MHLVSIDTLLVEMQGDEYVAFYQWAQAHPELPWATTTTKQYLEAWLQAFPSWIGRVVHTTGCNPVDGGSIPLSSSSSSTTQEDAMTPLNALPE